MIGDSVSERLKEMADNGDDIAIQKLSSCPKCSVQFAEMKPKITLCTVCEKSEAEDEMPDYTPVNHVPEGRQYCIICSSASIIRSQTCAMPGCANCPPKEVIPLPPEPNYPTAKKRIDEINKAVYDTYIAPTPMSKWAKLADEGGVAVKDDNNKTEYHLIPWEALDEIAKLYAFGAKKYSANNWRNGSGLGYLRCFNAMFRHLLAWVTGCDTDPETKLHPLASVAFYCLAVIYYEKTGKKNDDRFR